MGAERLRVTGEWRPVRPGFLPSGGRSRPHRGGEAEAMKMSLRVVTERPPPLISCGGEGGGAAVK